MVKGLDTFRKYFEKYEDQYVLIGGAACDIVFESNDTRSEEIEQSIEKPFKIMNMPNLELNLGEEKHREIEGPTLVKRGPKKN